MQAPTLDSERLRLRPWRNEDLDAFAAFTADPIVTRFVGGVFSRDDTWRRIAMLVGHWTLRGFGNWVIEDKATGAFAGYSGLWMPEGWKEPELMWGLAPACHGKGYATAAARRARAYAFEELGWKTLVSYIASENAPSQAVAARLGAQRDGQIEIRGTAVDVWLHPSPSH